MSEIKLGALLSLDRCPHCSVNRPNLRRAHSQVTANYRGLKQRHWGVYICEACGGLVTANSQHPNGVVLDTYPSPRIVSDAIPERPAAFLSQAIDSLHSPSGAVMLAASAVDAMLKKIGLPDGTLNSRIDEAATRHLITPEMAAWAHDIRLDANDQRHAEENAELPSQEDAMRCVDFALALAELLFVIPSRVRRGREAAFKNAKKSGAT